MTNKRKGAEDAKMLTDEQARQVVMDAAQRLNEHFEAVQILVTRTHQANTHFVSKGVGNWYTRMGMAHEFIDSARAADQASEIAKVIRPPEVE